MKKNQLEEKITYFRPAALPEVTVMKVENTSRLWRLFHESYDICTVPEGGGGGGEWKYRKKGYTLQRYQLMFTEPGEIHETVKAYKPSKLIYVIHIPPSLMESIASEIGLKKELHFKSPESFHPSYLQKFCQFHAALENKETSLLEIQSRFRECVSLLLEQCGERTIEPITPCDKSALRKARDYIESNPSEEIPLETLGKMVDLSPCYLLRSFKKEFGLPPYRYQLRIRISKASEMLKKGMPVNDLDLGFTDQSHLIRHFKEVMGVTPGRYSRSVRPRFVSFNV